MYEINTQTGKVGIPELVLVIGSRIFYKLSVCTLGRIVVYPGSLHEVSFFPHCPSNTDTPNH